MKRYSDFWSAYARWIIPIIIVVVVVWIIHLLWTSGSAGSGVADVTSASPHVAVKEPAAPAPARTSAPNLSTVGANLLAEPGPTSAKSVWTEFHNAKPMGVSFDGTAGSVTIKLNGVTNGVQEAYQIIHSAPDKPIVVSGDLIISGSPLPASSDAEILILDSSRTPLIATVYGGKTGTVGTHKFATVLLPKGAAKQFVIAVLTGHASNSSTSVTFKNLKVALQAPK